MQALSQIKTPLSSIALFHSDRGKEFDNQLLDATIKTIKTEFVKNEIFTNTNELKQ